MSIENSLYNSLNRYKDSSIIPMHMPGHKQRNEFTLTNLQRIDMTEVYGTDNLHNPEGIIKEAQDFASNLYGSKKTFFLVNGSTVGIMAAITSVCKPGEEIIVARNSHRSVYDGLITVGAKPIYILPEYIKEYEVVGGISPEKVYNTFKENPNTKGIVITSPTYEGFVSDIKQICEIAHRLNKVVIVDEAHGAHFKFHDLFPKTALECGADIVIQSTHKTLPALTQCAMLHIGSDRVSPDTIASNLALFETSSPSYIFLSSLDYCNRLIKDKGVELFSNYVCKLQKLRAELSHLNKIELYKENIIKQYHVKDIDISKINLFLGKTSISGTDLDNILRERYDIQVELSSCNHIIGMTSMCDDFSWYNHFIESLKGIEDTINTHSVKADNYGIIELPQTLILPREAYFKEKKEVDLRDSIGAVSGDFIIPYPPGIPILVPGEKIEQQHIEYIDNLLKNYIEIIGITRETKMKVIEV